MDVACIVGEWANTTGLSTGATSCKCVPIASWPALGTVCGGQYDSKCGDNNYRECQNRALSTATTSNWVCSGTKFVGDKCSSDLECTWPRVCTGGTCAANLAVNAACYDTSYNSLGLCPITQYCNSQTRMCSNGLSAGALCVNQGAQCGVGLQCSLFSSTCEPYRIGYLAAGAQANASYECASGLYNRTDGKYYCVDWDAQLAIFKAQYENVVCDNTVSANPCGFLGRCRCSGLLSGNTAKCELNYPTPADFVKQFTLIADSFALPASGCEGLNIPGPDAFTDNNYCVVSSGFFARYLAFQCDILAATTIPAGTVDCYGYKDKFCNGASSVGASLFVTAIVSLFAFIIA